MSVSPEARPRLDRFEDRHSVGIINALPGLEWEKDASRRGNYYQDGVITSVIDPLEGTSYVLRSDQQYLNASGVERPSQIPTLLFVDALRGGWQVIPLLEIQRNDSPDSVYRLYANFDHRNTYQLGDGMRLQYQGWTTVGEGRNDTPALVVRSVHGSEASEIKSLLERLLAANLR